MLNQAREQFLKIFRHDASCGIIMLLLVIVALACQNSEYAVDYRAWLNTRAGFAYGSFELMKPLLLWINDGLISIFFFSIGLELKHEFMEGHMSQPRNIVLPALGAVGGILVPALIFFLCNMGDPYAMRGWAIPTATDTAFSLTLVLMLGKRVPSSLKVFLLSLAIFDDVGAILVIAMFYTSELSVYAFTLAGFAVLVLLTMNLLGVAKRLFYCVFGFLLWLSILQSGVHATLAGIITAFFIPLKKRDGTPLAMEIYHDIKGYLSFFILPLFVFANAGIDLSGITPQAFFSGVPMGIFLGLFIGKQVGIFGISYLCIRFKLCAMPEGATFKQLYGVCILTGIGFTMSLFIDGLAYQGSAIFSYTDSFAIIVASVLSGAAGYLYLRFFASDESGDKIISVKKLLNRGEQKEEAKDAVAQTAEDEAVKDEPAAQGKADEDTSEEALQDAKEQAQDENLTDAFEDSDALQNEKAPAAARDASEQEDAQDQKEPSEPEPGAGPALEQKGFNDIEPPLVMGKSKIVIADKMQDEPQTATIPEASALKQDEIAGTIFEDLEDKKSAPQKESTGAPKVRGKSKIVIELEDAPDALKAQSEVQDPALEQEPMDPVLVKGKGKIEIETAADDDGEDLIQKPDGEPALKVNDAASPGASVEDPPAPMPKRMG